LSKKEVKISIINILRQAVETHTPGGEGGIKRREKREETIQSIRIVLNDFKHNIY
jgi:hypothetical protein